MAGNTQGSGGLDGDPGTTVDRAEPADGISIDKFVMKPLEDHIKVLIARLNEPEQEYTDPTARAIHTQARESLIRDLDEAVKALEDWQQRFGRAQEWLA